MLIPSGVYPLQNKGMGVYERQKDIHDEGAVGRERGWGYSAMRWWRLFGLVVLLVGAMVVCLLFGALYTKAYAQEKCQAQFEANKPVVITATPCPGSYFVRWEGACAGQGPVCTLIMDSDKTTTAVIDLIPYPQRLRLLEFDRFTAKDLLRCQEGVRL